VYKDLKSCCHVMMKHVNGEEPRKLSSAQTNNFPK
jgi:hypothetical protein